MADGNYTRRSVLRRGSAAVGAGALASLAGCTDAVNSVVGGGGDYQSWLPEPGEIGDRDHLSFTYLDLAAFANNEDELSDETADGIETVESYWDPINVDWDEASSVLLVSEVVVAEAEYDIEDAVEDLEDADFDEETDHEGYRIFVREGRGIGVGNGRIITTTPFSRLEDPEDVIETIIDVNNGEEDRYVDESDDMATLVDALGSGASVSGRTTEEPGEPRPESGSFDEMVARGSRGRINGETSNRKYVVVYEDENGVDLDELEEWVDANDGSDERFDDLDDIEYDQQGRKGIITGTIDTDEI